MIHGVRSAPAMQPSSAPSGADVWSRSGPALDLSPPGRADTWQSGVALPWSRFERGGSRFGAPSPPGSALIICIIRAEFLP